jgi:phage shock protein E
MITKIIIVAIVAFLLFKFGFLQNGSLSSADAVKMIKEHPGVVIDVRTASEVSGGMLKDAIHADIMNGQFGKISADFDTSKTYYVYCASGMRSGKAVQALKAKGFEKVFNIGGFGGLKAAGAVCK